MVEPVTVGLGAIAAYLGKDGLQKLLGPTAEYLGGELRDFTLKRFETVGRILQNANEKLGDKLEESGAVPPKVLKQVIDDGSFADDRVEIEYLGGVVASSRSDVSRDNRGASVAKLVDSLSNYQLRAHYLIYASVRHQFSTSGFNFSPDDRPKMRLFFPFPNFINAMDFSDQEAKNVEAIFTHIFFGLHKQSLIEGNWMFGPVEHLKKHGFPVEKSGIVCIPSALGTELFLWAFGKGQNSLETLFCAGAEFKIDGLPNYVAGVRPCAKEFCTTVSRAAMSNYSIDPASASCEIAAGVTSSGSARSSFSFGGGDCQPFNRCPTAS